MRNRFYLPNLGRFMQSDPTGFDAGDMNLFRYCGNDPVDRSDPTGLKESGPQSMLVSSGHGDWDWYNGDVAMAQVDLQKQRPAGNDGGSKTASSEKGLQIGFERYPEKGPGGKPVVNSAMKRLYRTPRGRMYKAINRTVYVRPTDRDHPTGSYVGEKTGNLYLYLDPTNDRFYDETTFRNMSRHKGETPPNSDEGRAAVIAHEFGHSLLGYGKDIDSEIRNVRFNENPARDDLEIERRPSYDGNFVPR